VAEFDLVGSFCSLPGETAPLSARAARDPVGDANNTASVSSALAQVVNPASSAARWRGFFAPAPFTQLTG
jgi:hypothetical protein